MERIATVSNNIADATNVAATQVQSTLNSVKQNVNSAISDFSNRSVVNSTYGFFLQTNSMIAKVAFILLVLIVFLIVLKIGLASIGYLLSPSNSPYIIKGMITGSDSATILTDPGNPEAIPIHLSNNQNGGMEFTWSVWLKVNDIVSTPTKKYNCIFTKGDGRFTNPDGSQTDSGLAGVSNSPGMYIKKEADNTMSLYVVMNTMTSASSSSADISEYITVPNMPLGKWFHVALRLKNMVMDVYVNGSIVKRHSFINLPKQNYSSIFVCPNSGFTGNLSNLRYFDYGISVFEINNILYQGVNLSLSSASSAYKSRTGQYNYLSTSWYSNSLYK